MSKFVLSEMRFVVSVASNDVPPNLAKVIVDPEDAEYFMLQGWRASTPNREPNLDSMEWRHLEGCSVAFFSFSFFFFFSDIHPGCGR